MFINLGESVPLSAQLQGGEGNLSVSARVYDEYGILLSTVLLEPVKGGLYINSEYKMPASKFIWVQYLVLNSKEYGVGVDLFYLRSESYTKTKDDRHFYTGRVTLRDVRLEEKPFVAHAPVQSPKGCYIGEVVERSKRQGEVNVSQD